MLRLNFRLFPPGGARRAAERAWIAAATLMALLASGAHAQVVRDDFWVTNGSVSSVAKSGSTLYIGGSFTSVGLFSGRGVPLSTASGTPAGPFPKVSGVIRAVAPDGAGGWYIGGGFGVVGGQSRVNVAHVLADGTVSPFTTSPNGTVYALAVGGSTVYIGGFFGQVDGQFRGHLAALDATTGALKAWNPGTGGSGAQWVYALVLSGSTVYVGGNFTAIGSPSQARGRLAAVDATTGAVAAWNPNVNPFTSSSVYSLALSGGTMYVGGTFGLIGGQSRGNLAAVDATTGAVSAWNPGANSGVRALATDGSTVYAGGGFTTAGGQPRNRIAALDTATGAATAWNPDANGTVWSLLLDGSTVYAGGEFDAIGGADREYLAALDVATGGATGWNPNPNDYVYALAPNGSTIYAGGAFTSIGPSLARNNLAALDVATNTATTWDPNPNGLIRALAMSGSTVYAAGDFTTVGGQARSHLAGLDGNTGNATAWNPNADDVVEVLTVSGSSIYAGGLFGNIGGQARNGLAELDLATGTATSWNPDVQRSGMPGLVLAIQREGSTVYAGGGFSSVGGQARTNAVAVDAVTGAPTAWNAGLATDYEWVRAIAVGGSTVFLGGDFESMIGGQPRAHIAELDATSGNATSWNPGANNSVHSLALSGSTLYAGGLFGTIGGLSRSGIAALDAASGAISDWDSGVPVRAFSLVVNGSNVYVGGGFSPYLFAIEQDVVSVPPVVVPARLELAQNRPNPAGSSTLIEFTLPTAAPVTLSVFDLQGRRVASLLEREMRPAGANRVAFRPGRLASGVYLYRLEALGRSASRRLIVVE
jgi:hypothetical protein